MKVKATRLGYYGLERVREGQVFEIANDAQFSKRWMEKVEEDEVAAVPAKASAKPGVKAAALPPVQPHAVPAAPSAARPAGQPTGAAAVI